MLTHHLLQTGTIQCKFSFTKNNFSSPNSTFFFCSEEDIPSKARLLLDELYEKSTKDHYPEGCFVGIIQDADLKTLKSSLLSIIQSFGTPLPWGRESSFLAKRFFVTVPGGLAMSMEEKLRIHPESSESDVNAAFRAITDSNFLQTVENIIAHLQRVKSSLKPIVQLQQLLAIQVNLQRVRVRVRVRVSNTGEFSVLVFFERVIITASCEKPWILLPARVFRHEVCVKRL
mgnify:CR=1 FL=1